jgi:V8-like Glu-specific endopeptidase
MEVRVAILLSVLALLSTAARADQVVLTLVPDGSVTAKPGSGATIVDRGKATVSAQVAGNEDTTSCEVYGRRSSANGRAAVTTSSASSPTTLSFRLDAVATASGGHYRTGTCIANRRIGFTGHDTEAAVDAVATAVVRIHFDGGRPNIPYFVKISRSQSGNPQNDQLTGPDGKVVPLTSPDSPYPVIISKPGQDYFLRTSVAAVARNNGGCCSDQTSATSDMTITVEPAPLLFGGRQMGYIAGGLQTENYKNVAVILLEGLPHCTATLVAPGVLVTAAHCVNGHMTKDRLAAGKVTAAFGTVYSQPLFPPIEVTRAIFPNSGDMVFDPKTLRHDIAVLYLKPSANLAGIAPSELHSGRPSWQQIRSEGTKLDFVGFGFNPLNNENKDIGIKRAASWQISGYDDYAVSFAAPGTNTCSGDSGGPGFLRGSKSHILAAITSGGDDACTYGFDTRIDAYLGWLKPRIAQ